MEQSTMMPQDPGNEQILLALGSFAQGLTNVLQAMYSVTASTQETHIIDNGIAAREKFFVSILFTGTVYGEYVLALNEDVAVRILADAGVDSATAGNYTHADLADSFCELLNIVVGGCVASLGESHKKLSITAPRVYFGEARYPRVKTGHVILTSEKGSIDCYLYIDRMKLDIAASYKEALASLLKMHRDLQSVLEKLKNQQSLLIQAEKMAALGNMAAGVAHEINSPLAAVCLLGEQLKDVVQQDVFNKNACLEMLESIEKTTARISRITSGLRAFAHNVRDSEFTRASLKEMVNDTLLLYGKHLRDRDIRAELGDIPVTLEIECRPPEISQVLVNLLDNACDAIALLSEKWIKIQASDLGDSIEIAITDAGHGVRESIRKNIFDPFFTTKDIGQGPGLGLSISKGIIGGHNGTIRLDEKNAHTCFVIQLPKIQSAAKKREKISA